MLFKKLGRYGLNAQAWSPDPDFLAFLRPHLHRMCEDDNYIDGTSIGKIIYEIVHDNPAIQQKYKQYEAMRVICEICKGNPNFRKQVWSQKDGFTLCNNEMHLGRV